MTFYFVSFYLILILKYFILCYFILLFDGTTPHRSEAFLGWVKAEAAAGISASPLAAFTQQQVGGKW